MPKETQRDNSHTVMPVKSLEELMRWKRHVREHYTLKEYTFMELGLDTGAHPDDLLGLKWEDLQYEEASAPPISHYYVMLPRAAQSTQKFKHLLSAKTADYLLQLRKEFPNDVYIFQSQSRNKSSAPQHWETSHVRKFLRISAKEIGLKEIVSALTLRKSYGYHMVVNGTWTLRQLQHYFGQPRLSTTRKYIEITNERIIEDSLD